MEILLRRFQLSDIDYLWEWMGDEIVAQYTSWDACATKAAAADYLATTIFHHPWYRAICLEEKVVGFVAAKPGTGIDGCRAELSYGLARTHWGRGVATAAVQIAVAALLAELPELERVEGLATVENVASRRVLEKAGFTWEGVLRRYRMVRGRLWDMECFSFTRSDLM